MLYQDSHNQRIEDLSEAEILKKLYFPEWAGKGIIEHIKLSTDGEIIINKDIVEREFEILGVEEAGNQSNMHPFNPDDYEDDNLDSALSGWKDDIEEHLDYCVGRNGDEYLVFRP